MTHYQHLLLGGPVRVAPHATFATPEFAANVRNALADRQTALMAHPRLGRDGRRHNRLRDAFSAVFLRGLSLGQELGVAAAPGGATAARVARGLGTDAGNYSMETVEDFAANASPLA